METTVKTSKELNALHKEKSEALIILGYQLHKLIRDGKITDPDITKISERISKLDVEIYTGSGYRVPVEGEGICPGCGEQLASSMSAFCGKCGTNVKEFYSRDMAPCDKCGQLIQSKAQYCTICGVRREQQ